MLTMCVPSFAQQFKQEGKKFVQTSSVTATKDSTKTEYTFQTKDGKNYPIFLSKTGKAYIWRVSKNGKGYRMYLPQIGKTINPRAYEKDSKPKNN